MAIEIMNTAALAVDYSLDSDYDTERFIKMRLRICHDGVNPKGTCFDINDINAAKDSLKNIPILANVIFDEDDQPGFGSHDMDIENDKVNSGEYRLIYKEVPIGVIPETNNYEVSEYDGKQYVYADAYIWRGYSNYAEDIIKRDKNIKLSMEISVNQFSYNAAEKIYNITDFKYTGITFLGNDIGTGMKNAMAATECFAADDIRDKMLIIMQELKEDMAVFNNKEGDNGNMNEDIKSDASDAADFSGESEPAADDAASNTIAEFGDESKTEDSKEFIKTFALSHEDIRYALYSLLAPIESEKKDCYFIESVYDTYFDYIASSDNSMHRQGYTKSGDSVALEGECIDIYVEKLTSEEKASLDNMRNKYAAMQDEVAELRAYKAGIEKDIVTSQKQEILNKWSDSIGQSAEFETLKSHLDDYSNDELETKCKCIFADMKAIFTFSAKPGNDGMVRIPINEAAINTNTESSPYGDLFEKYGDE